MRKPKEHVALDGTRSWRVRFRVAGTETSETFRRKADALTFAAILDSGQDGVTEALRWLAERKKEGEAATFGEWFAVYTAQLTGITSRTRADYEALHRRYLTSLDHMPLPLITRPHVAAVVNRLEADGLSPKTIKNVIHMLSSVMALAVDEGRATRNPVKRVRLPKAGVIEQDARFLTHEEFGVLLQAIPEFWRPLTIFLVGTGMRWSEATALLARDVDATNGTIAVRRAWKKIPGGWELGPPKSAKGRRTINPAVMALAAVASQGRKPAELVFQTQRGNVVRHSNYYGRVWIPACEGAGFDPRPRIHDLRHTHASWLISDGIGLEAIQAQLGHESIETTRKVYAHLLPAVGVAVGRSASAALERALSNGSAVAELSPADTASAPG